MSPLENDDEGNDGSPASAHKDENALVMRKSQSPSSSSTFEEVSKQPVTFSPRSGRAKGAAKRVTFGTRAARRQELAHPAQRQQAPDALLKERYEALMKAAKLARSKSIFGGGFVRRASQGDAQCSTTWASRGASF